ncbi:hypothetical protein QNM99_13590 [Pseudomonas sp. PCH446]
MDASIPAPDRLTLTPVELLPSVLPSLPVSADFPVPDAEAVGTAGGVLMVTLLMETMTEAHSGLGLHDIDLKPTNFSDFVQNQIKIPTIAPVSASPHPA